VLNVSYLTYCTAVYYFPCSAQYIRIDDLPIVVRVC